MRVVQKTVKIHCIALPGSRSQLSGKWVSTQEESYKVSRYLSWKLRPGDHISLRHCLVTSECLWVTLTSFCDWWQKGLGKIDEHNLRLNSHLWWVLHKPTITSQPESEAHLSLKPEQKSLVRSFFHWSRLRGIMERSFKFLPFLGAGGAARRRRQ